MKQYMTNHPERAVGNHLHGKTYEEAYGPKKARDLIQIRRERKQGTTLSPEAREKIRNARLGQRATPEARAKMSKAHRALWQDPQYIQKMREAWSIKPNGAECNLLALLKDHNLNFNYVGDFQLNLSGKFPDFAHESKPLLIELFGEYWHEPKEEQQRTEHFAQFGYDTLIIWCSQLQSPDQVVETVREFMSQSPLLRHPAQSG